MSVSFSILSLVTDDEVIDIAQGQAALTLALAERLEMVVREREESKNLNLDQLEFVNDRS
jgi:16S rRNA A1518/A1519 N6-dimethyltransferase RsmA/KsgA/DIM1 with predicted DNA glycosylase/AP lyase activity